jgi:hypothetical protein
MFTKIQYQILSLFAGGTVLLSMLASSVGFANPVGPSGPQGSVGEVGPAGEDGREVEFSVNGNVLQWRYVGETTWRSLDLDFGGSSSTIEVNETGYFSNWIFNIDPTFAFDYPSRIIVNNSATYATDLITNQGYTGIATYEALLNIGTTSETRAGKYVLTSNIDASSFVYNHGVTPTALIDGEFTGIFDGAGYTISGLTLDGLDNEVGNFGLFYNLRGAEVRNLNLLDFSFKGFNIYQSGALAAEVQEGDNNDLTVIDNVNVRNFVVEASNRIRDTGGIVGDIEAGALIYRSNSMDVVFRSGNSMYGVGGIFGAADYDTYLELYELSSQLRVESIHTEEYSEFDRVGGLGGDVKAGATILAYRSHADLIGPVRFNSGGFIANIAGYSKVVFEEVSSYVDLSVSGSNSSDQIGGLIGFYGRDGLLFINNAHTTGNIAGFYNAGGVIGFAKQGSSARISNTTSEVNISAYSDVGGILGELGDYGHKWVFDNITVNATFSQTESHDFNASLDLYDFGGLIGEINSGGDNVNTANQVLVTNSAINTEFNIVMEDTDNVTNNGHYFSRFGGLFGFIDQENQIRVINTSVDFDVTLQKVSYTQDSYAAYDIYEVGGIVGYVEDSNMLLINIDVTLNVNYIFDGYVPVHNESNTMYFNVSDVGGIAGEQEEGIIAIIASEIVLNVFFSVVNFNAPNMNYYINLDDVGGLVGLLDDGSFLTAEDVTVDVTYDIAVNNFTLGADKFFRLEIYDNGVLIGQPSGIAVLKNVTRTVTVTLDIIEGNDDSITVKMTNLEADLGRRTPFVFFS